MREFLLKLLGGVDRKRVTDSYNQGCGRLAKALVKAGIVIWIDGEGELHTEKCVE